MANGQYINQEATRLVDQPGAVEVYNGDSLVSMIAKDYIEAIYLTNKKDKGETQHD